MATRIRFGGVAFVAVALALGCQTPGLQGPEPSASGSPAPAASTVASNLPLFPMSLQAKEGLAAYAGHQVRVRSLVSGALVPVAAQAGATQVANSLAVSALAGGKLYLQNPPVGPLLFEFTKPAAPAAAARTLQQLSVPDQFFLLQIQGFLSPEELNALNSLPSISDLSSYLKASGKSMDSIAQSSGSSVEISPERIGASTISSLVFQHSILNAPGQSCSLPNSINNQPIINLTEGLKDVHAQALLSIQILQNQSLSIINLNLVFITLYKKKSNHNKVLDDESSRILAQTNPEGGPCEPGGPTEALARFKEQVKAAGLDGVLNDAFIAKLNQAYFGAVPLAPWSSSPAPSVTPGASPGLASPSPSPTLVPQPSPSMNETGTEGTDRPDPPLEEA